MTNQAGKGSRYRPVDAAKYAAGYVQAFPGYRRHTRYKAKRPPRADCIVCRRLWREALLK